VTVGIYIDPAQRSLLQDHLFTRNTGRNQSSLIGCLRYMKEIFEPQGVPVHSADLLPPPNGVDRHLYVSIGNYKNHERITARPDVVMSAYMVTEAPVVEPLIYKDLRVAKHRFKRIYSCIDADAIAEFVGEPVPARPLRWPIDYRGVDGPLWSRSDRRFLVMINMNKLPRLSKYELYTERMRAVEYFGRTGDIDLYGIGWDKASERMGHTRMPYTFRRMQIAANNWLDRIHPDPLLVAARKVFKGELETKWETLSEYDFVLCFENNFLPGWLTEKLFDNLRVGTIPIYWGATDIAALVPIECYIDMREFAGYPELKAYLKSLDRKKIMAYREAGRAFLESPGFTPFSKETFAGIFRDLLEEDAKVRVSVG
jgi:alpha(1,3/1,4) fucosyltransferase